MEAHAGRGAAPGCPGNAAIYNCHLQMEACRLQLLSCSCSFFQLRGENKAGLRESRPFSVWIYGLAKARDENRCPSPSPPPSRNPRPSWRHEPPFRKRDQQVLGY